MRRRQVATFALICAAWLVQAGSAQALPDGSDRQGLPKIPPGDPVSTWAVATTNTCVGQVGTAAAVAAPTITPPTLPAIGVGTCPSQVLAGASAALAEPGWAEAAAGPTVANVENTAANATTTAGQVAANAEYTALLTIGSLEGTALGALMGVVNNPPQGPPLTVNCDPSTTCGQVKALAEGACVLCNQVEQNAPEAANAVADGSVVSDPCAPILAMQTGINNAPGCYVGDPTAPPAVDPYNDEGAPYDNTVETADTYKSDATIADDLAIDLAGHANVVQLQLEDEATASAPANARVFLAPSATPGVNGDAPTDMVQIASGQFSGNELALGASYTDIIREAAERNAGSVDLLVIVEQGDRTWEQFFVRRIGVTPAGDLAFLNKRRGTPGRFLVDMNGPDSYALDTSSSRAATDIPSGCVTAKYGDPFNRSTVLGEAHAGASQVVNFIYGTEASQGATQTIDVVVSDDPASGFSISGESSKKVSGWEKGRYWANYNGNQTRFKVNGLWTYQEYRHGCAGTQKGWRYSVEPVGWAGGPISPGDQTGEVCRVPMKYIADFGRGGQVGERNQNSMRWKAGVTIFGVTVGAENENSTTATRFWEMGTARTHHFLCGTDALPPKATRTFAQAS